MEFADYPRPSLAVDPAVLAVSDGEIYTILWQRAWKPFPGKWALPGVFVGQEESLEEAAKRGIYTKVGISTTQVQQLFAWNKPSRDERGWVVTIAYFVIVPFVDLVASHQNRNSLFKIVPSGGYGAEDLEIKVIDANGSVIELAFDHGKILTSVLERLREVIWNRDTALQFLPENFTMRSLQGVYEVILGRSLNKDSFRKRVTHTQGLVMPTGTMEANVSHRPAELYQRSLDYGF